MVGPIRAPRFLVVVVAHVWYEIASVATLFAGLALFGTPSAATGFDRRFRLMCHYSAKSRRVGRRPRPGDSDPPPPQPAFPETTFGGVTALNPLTPQRLSEGSTALNSLTARTTLGRVSWNLCPVVVLTFRGVRNFLTFLKVAPRQSVRSVRYTSRNRKVTSKDGRAGERMANFA